MKDDRPPSGATIESIELLQSMIDNRCGSDSFESRLYQHIKPCIRINHPVETNLSHEEEICLALSDVYNS